MLKREIVGGGCRGRGMVRHAAYGDAVLNGLRSDTTLRLDVGLEGFGQ